MAFSFDNNVAVSASNGAANAFALKTLLKIKGWTVVYTGDGLALGSTSDILTTELGGAGGMGNIGAHWTLRSPADGAAPYNASRDLTWQVAGGGSDTTRSTARVVFSEGATANTGSASPTQVPTYTDEHIIVGGGTPAAPTYTSVQSNAGTRNIIAGGVTENYSWGMSTWLTGSYPFHNWVFDGCKRTLVGDLHPYVVGYWGGDYLQSTLNADELFAKYNSVAALQAVKAFGMPGASLQLRDSAVDGKVTPIDMYYGRLNNVASPGGYKGVSSLLQWSTGTRAPRDRGTENTAFDRIVYSLDVIGYWNGSVVA